MKIEDKKKIVHEYIEAYNEFNVDKMLRNIHEKVIFKNISDGEVNLELTGKTELKKQAEQVVKLFEERNIKITAQKIEGEVLENKIEFKGILALDIPDGPKAGETIELKGKTIFKFKDNKIILIEDISWAHFNILRSILW